MRGGGWSLVADVDGACGSCIMVVASCGGGDGG